MLLWLAKGALGDAFTVAWSLDYFRRHSGIQRAVVLASPAVAKVVRELDFVEEVLLLPEKSDLPGWFRLRAHCRRLPVQILGLQGKGRHLGLLARSLRPQVLLSWQSLEAMAGDRTIPLADILQDPAEGFRRLNYQVRPVAEASPMLPFKNLQPENNRSGVVFAPLTSSAWPSKAWPIRHSLTLAEELGKAGIPLTIVGAREEGHMLAPFEKLGIPVKTGLSIPDLGALLSRSRLSLSGDSMLAHAAPLYGAKALILLGPTTERYISRHPGLPQPVVFKKEEISCLGCHKPMCSLSNTAESVCLAEVSPRAVLEVIQGELAS